MTLGLALGVAIRAMSANVLRTLLTTLGIIIGIGAVIGLMSIGRGLNELFTGQVQGLGANLLFVTPGNFEEGGVSRGQRPTLTYDDALALNQSYAAPSVVAAVPDAFGSAQLIIGGENVSTQLRGTTHQYESVRNSPVEFGEFISREHVEARSRVIVLGSSVAEDLFEEVDPIGLTVRVSTFGRRGVPFRVIGVLESKGGGGGFGPNQDDVAIMPITTMQSRLDTFRNPGGQINVSSIAVEVISEDELENASEQIGEILRERHRVVEDDFTIQSQRDLLGFVNTFTTGLTIFLGGIAAISLVVGGIGIMNIMLVSVTERTREIGIRKALGAKRRDILLQFLLESVIVSVIGAVIGIGLGGLLSFIVSQIPLGDDTFLPTLVAGDAILLAVGVSMAIGLFFGIYPAARAASLNPIDALRYE
jgi:putative ABC transport system permease protein